MSEFKGAVIDRKNPSKSERDDDMWDVIYPIVVDPAGLEFPQELADTIFQEWERNTHRGGGVALCQAVVEGDQVRFVVPKQKVNSIESSLPEMEKLLAREVPKYKARIKREEKSGDDLDDILNRLK